MGGGIGGGGERRGGIGGGTTVYNPKNKRLKFDEKKQNYNTLSNTYISLLHFPPPNNLEHNNLPNPKY